ncbi:hypothetical protein [Sphaerisporangium dianthi]|uniref:Uncharacterized protein n=1 Tax=Sphaerisporangium dianthi TaxID=1436120 RepID=A0ABV9CJB6_9ACTN
MTVSGDQIQAIVAREVRMARFVAGSRFGRLLAIGGLIAVGWFLGVVFGAGPAAAEARVPARQVVAKSGDMVVPGHAGASADAVKRRHPAVGAVERGHPAEPGGRAVTADGGMFGDAGTQYGLPAELRDLAEGLDPLGLGRPGGFGEAGREGAPTAGYVRDDASDVPARRSGSATSHVATGPASAGGFPTVRVDAPADARAMAGKRVDGLTSQSKPVSPRPPTADHSAGANGFVPRAGSGPLGPGFGDVARSVFDPRLAVAPAVMASVPTPVVRPAADDPSFSPD